MITGLLDTQALLWTFAADDRLPAWLGGSIERDPASFGVSDVSLWEVAIKTSTGKLRVPDNFPQVVKNFGFREISITRAHVWAVRDLPMHHRDPFDRLLVAQARELGVPVVTADPAISGYEVGVLW